MLRERSGQVDVACGLWVPVKKKGYQKQNVNYELGRKRRNIKVTETKLRPING